MAAACSLTPRAYSASIPKAAKHQGPAATPHMLARKSAYLTPLTTSSTPRNSPSVHSPSRDPRFLASWEQGVGRTLQSPDIAVIGNLTPASGNRTTDPSERVQNRRNFLDVVRETMAGPVAAISRRPKSQGS